MNKFALFVIAFAPVLANADEQCGSSQQAKLLQVEKELKWAVSAIPAVPPKQAEYFSKEEPAAALSGSPARIGALTQQPFYEEWGVQTSLNQALTDIDILKGVYNSKVPDEFILDFEARYGTGLLGDLVAIADTLGRYLEQQSTKPSPMVVVPTAFKLDTLAITQSGAVREIIMCAIKRLSANARK